MKKISLLFSIFFLPAFAAHAELCPSNHIQIPESTPTSRFKVVDETGQENFGAGQLVIDQETGLMWDRCQWGKKWSPADLKCVSDPNHNGSYTPNWKEALLIVKDGITDASPYLGKIDWRLPNIKELASIIERKCFTPSINDEVFPNTDSSMFWSNTHVAGALSVRVVDFSNGQVTAIEIDPPAPPTGNFDTYLRLVRDVQPEE